MSLVSQVASLQDSLSGYAAKDRVPWQVAQLVNALVEQAKQTLPDNPTIAPIEPFRPSDRSSYAYSGDIGSARAILSQLYSMLPDDS